MDLERKLQEDPLIALKQQEIDSRRKILDNPVKMKEIKAHVSGPRRPKILYTVCTLFVILITLSPFQLEKMRKKKKKKEKKNRKKRKRSPDPNSDDSANEADLDAMLLQKLGGGSEGPSAGSRRSRSR